MNTFKFTDKYHLNAAIAILNYNSLPYLEKFLPTLMEFTPSWVTIYIIDNDSLDHSKQFVNERFPQIVWIQLEENLGYSGGYAAGLKQIHEDYWVLLNSDVKVTENWFEPLISCLLKEKYIAACQPKLLSDQNPHFFEHAGASGGFIDFLGYPFCRGRIFDFVEKDEAQYDKSIQCFWASGACLAIKRKAYLEAGGFDTRFFMHMEEIDLCWRLNQLGYQIYCEPKSVVYHVGGGMLDYQSPKKVFYNFRNSLLMCYKNWSVKEIIWKLPCRVVLDQTAMIRELLRGNFRIAFSIFKALFFFIPFIFTPRNKTFTSYSKNLSCIYPNSIIKKYFIQKVKTYQEL